MLYKLKIQPYHGGNLKGVWLFTRKLDGICANLDALNRRVLSRHNHPLYNFEEIFNNHRDLKGIYEVFRTDWETSVSLCRSKTSRLRVEREDLYQLDIPEERIILDKYVYPTEEFIKQQLQEALDRGDEGLVLIPLESKRILYAPNYNLPRLKVKPAYNLDVRVTGFREGTGKFKGLLGALTTNYGDVGIGFSMADRYELWANRFIISSSIIEVKTTGMTRDNKMRFPSFVRRRWDKDSENLECSSLLIY